MSFKIDKPGFYRLRADGKAEVLAVDAVRNFAIGFHQHDPFVPKRWTISGEYSDVESHLDIVSPLVPGPPTPPVDPGEGWRLVDPDSEPLEAGDEHYSLTAWRPWFPAYAGRTQGEIAKEAPFGLGIVPTRRRVPPPFSISTHGPGVYERRDGERVQIHDRDGSEMFPWRSVNPIGWGEWSDNGIYRYFRHATNYDLVRYLGPLPVPEPQWVATCELRLLRLPPLHKGDVVLRAKCDNGFGYSVRLEQKWTRGDEVQWRSVEVTP
jgi:hypothetical protein